MTLKLRAQCPRAQGGGAAEKKAGWRVNSILPYSRAAGSFKRMLGRWRPLLEASTGRSEELNHCNRAVPIREVAPHPVGKLQEVVTLELFDFPGLWHGWSPLLPRKSPRGD